MTIKKAAAVIAAAGLSLGLVGLGVGASYSDSATVSQGVSVGAGSFGCQLSSTDPNMVISNGGHTATLNWPDINNSAAGSDYSNITVKNTGSIALVTHWTEATSGTIAFQPAGRMGYTVGGGANLLSTDIGLAAGTSHSYDNVGFQWAQLTNADEGQSASVAYTVACAEGSPPPTSQVSYVGIAAEQAAQGNAALTLPAGWQPGDTALVMTYGQTGGHNAQVPAGYTQIGTSGAGNMQSILSDRVLVAGDTVVPASSTGLGEEVAIYRGVAGIGAHSSTGGNLNNVGGASFPLMCGPSLDGVNGPAMVKTDGSSWVTCMGGDGFATTNANQMVFDSNTTNRSAGLANNHTGLADTNGGVTAWAKVGWPGDNFVLPGSHGVVVFDTELLSK